MFHKFGTTPDTYGSFETFALDGSVNDDLQAEDGNPMEAGWYWWPCFPGCLPDGDPTGPFESEMAAVNDALREG